VIIAIKIDGLQLLGAQVSFLIIHPDHLSYPIWQSIASSGTNIVIWFRWHGH
jgi:hypothetical protein